METIKVNMNPNPLDVQTIHASQNDTEARQWGFELHNNGDVIDASEVTDQITFKAYKGGTEQLLPENTSTPTTSPFKGDIKYPQGLLSDQEFTYRQSPTEEDGLAFVESIKGNTLVWNQLVRDNLTDISQIQTNGSLAKTVSNNVLTLTVNGTVDQNSFVEPNSYANRIQIPTGHKALVIYNVNPSVSIRTRISYATVATPIKEVQCPANTWTQVANVITSTNNARVMLYVNLGQTLSEGNTVQIKNITVFDLTLMGLDSITEPSEFTSLFSLPYYAYNQGTLLSFNGTGIKTTGKNLYVGSPSFDDFVDRDTYTLADETYNGHEVIYKSEAWHGVYKNILVIANVTYTFSSMVKCSAPTIIRIYNKNADILEWKTIGTKWTRISATFTPSQDTVERLRVESNNTNTVYLSEYQLELGSSASEYEPYTENTLSLPISTYFSNGMDGVGTDYDELTNTKATTRMARVDLGSRTWANTQADPHRFYANISSLTPKAKEYNADEVANIKCVLYTTKSRNDIEVGDKNISMSTTNLTYINIYDTAYSVATDFKSAMSGVYLVYPLATPTETSFYTASLVTENAEIPLSNEDGTLIGKCTEQLSENPGFIDAKIKLSDSDGTCYSNKIQLHVERSPQ